MRPQTLCAAPLPRCCVCLTSERESVAGPLCVGVPLIATRGAAEHGCQSSAATKVQTPWVGAASQTWKAKLQSQRAGHPTRLGPWRSKGLCGTPGRAAPRWPFCFIDRLAQHAATLVKVGRWLSQVDEDAFLKMQAGLPGHQAPGARERAEVARVRPGPERPCPCT